MQMLSRSKFQFQITAISICQSHPFFFPFHTIPRFYFLPVFFYLYNVTNAINKRLYLQ